MSQSMARSHDRMPPAINIIAIATYFTSAVIMTALGFACARLLRPRPPADAGVTA